MTASVAEAAIDCMQANANEAWWLYEQLGTAYDRLQEENIELKQQIREVEVEHATRMLGKGG